jgi:hypothetical protein
MYNYNMLCEHCLLNNTGRSGFMSGHTGAPGRP